MADPNNPVVQTDPMTVPTITNLAAPAPTAGLLTNAQTSTAQINPASSGPAQQASVNKWNVDAPQTVQGQISGIIAQNSPLMQQAQTTALDQMNQRGLLNSSMAIGAGHQAVYNAALPIATADAATYAKSAGFNADASNTIGVSNTAAANQALEANAARTQQANLVNQQSVNANVAKQMDEAFLAATNNADNETKLKLQTLDANTKIALTNTEANNKAILQSSASASDLYKQVTVNIANIASNKDMDPTYKQSMIDQQMNVLQNGLFVQGKFAPLDLSKLVDFSGTGNSAPTPEQQTATAAQQQSAAAAPPQQNNPSGGQTINGNGGQS
jgi:hypothetical protein